MEIILLKKGAANRATKGTWFVEDGWVTIVCPNCGQKSAVCRDNHRRETKHLIDLDGNIDPKIECPHLTCTEINYYRLESWRGYEQHI